MKVPTSLVLLGWFCFSIAWAQTPAKESPASRIDLENILSKLKIKGRAALGYLDSGKSGSYGSGSFEVPDVKLQLAFQPDEKNSFTTRFNLNNGAANAPLLDYMFVQAKDFIPSLKETPFSLSGRLGRMKLGVGEETWTNNSIEGALPSNSAANADGSDEGVELSGKFWAASIGNGSRGVGFDTGSAKALFGKLFYSPWNPLYVSATYYDSGSLKASQSEVSVAGLVAPPTGATNWERRLWEADIRFDFQKGTSPRDPPSTSDSKALVRLSYGAFRDGVTSANNRRGKFGFIEGLYNCTQKIYLGGRVSLVDLNDSQTAALNGVTTNHYERYSLGIGYRWFENTHVKLGVDHNNNGGAGTRDASDDLISALLTLRI